MQGLWKENLGGWDRKNNKRKSQTRNNTLRDKARAILKVYDGFSRTFKTDSDKFYINNESLISTYNHREVFYESEVIKAKIQIPYIESDTGKVEFSEFGTFYSYNISMEIYKDHNSRSSSNYTWIDFKTGKPIKFLLNITEEQFNLIKIEEIYKLNKTVKLDSSKIKTISYRYSYNTKNAEFIYRKKLPSWKRWSFYNNGNRKYAQKKASSRDRQNIRNWINKSDFDLEPKTHSLSKSILWDIS